MLALKEVDGLQAGGRRSAGFHDKNFTELDGLVQPKVISKTDQELVRIIGQHLISIGLQ